MVVLFFFFFFFFSFSSRFVLPFLFFPKWISFACVVLHDNLSSSAYDLLNTELLGLVIVYPKLLVHVNEEKMTQLAKCCEFLKVVPLK